MALYARTTVETVDFVSRKDSDHKSEQVLIDPNDASKGTREQVTIGPGASRFKVRPLDVFLMAHIYDNASSITGKQGSEEVGIKTRMNQTNIDTVRFGLVGLPDNWADRKGNPIRYEVEKVEVNGIEYTAVKSNVLSSLGLQLIQEMAERIKEISEVTSEDEGNFDGASQLSAS